MDRFSLNFERSARERTVFTMRVERIYMERVEACTVSRGKVKVKFEAESIE